MIVSTCPSEEGKRPTRQTAYFLQDDLLAASDDVETLRSEFLAAMNGGRTIAWPHCKPSARSWTAAQIGDGGVVARKSAGSSIRSATPTMVRETAHQAAPQGHRSAHGLKNQGFTADSRRSADI